MYSYNYTLPSLKDHKGFGYIIDYIEEIPNIEKYLSFKEVEIDGTPTKIIAEETLTNFILTALIELNRKIKKS